MVKVSVIIPVYNVEKYLDRCLKSVLNQTYKDIEIILVDDGSTDGSEKICDKYKNQNNRVKVLHQKNSGVSYARLNGFNISQGEYITFVDPDDYLDLQAIEKMVYIIEKENVDMVVCQVNDIYKLGIKKEIIRPKVGIYDKNKIVDLLKTNALYDSNTDIAGMSLMLCTKLIKRKFLKDKLSRGLDIIYGEDQIIVISLLYEMESMYVMSDYLYYYDHTRTGQLTETYDEKIWRNIEFYIKKLKEIDKNKYLWYQIDNRLIITLSHFVSIALRNNKNDVIKKIKLDTNLLHEIQFNKLSWKNVIKFILLKYNLMNTYKSLLRIKNRIELL